MSYTSGWEVGIGDEFEKWAVVYINVEDPVDQFLTSVGATYYHVPGIIRFKQKEDFLAFVLKFNLRPKYYARNEKKVAVKSSWNEQL